MSSRHHTSHQLAKSARRVETHRDRQAARTSLQVSDLEDVLDPPTVHRMSQHRSSGPDAGKGRRFRHWKQPFWKRRTEVRRERNEAAADPTYN